MHICMLTTSFPRYKGDYAGVFVHELAKELVQRGNKVSVIAPHAVKSLGKETLDGVGVSRFQYFFPLSSQRLAYGSGVVSNIKTSWMAKVQIPFFIISSFLKTLRESRRADIIHAHWAVNGFVGMLLKWIYRKPLIITLHGSDAYYFSRNVVLKSIARYILKRTNHLIVVSKEIETILIAMGIDKDNITVIHNGVPQIEDFLKVPILNKPNNRLLWIGRFTTEKNPLHALRIFKKVKESIPSAHLTMVGEGPEQASCRQYCAQHVLGEKVTFVGRKEHDDIPEIFYQHSVLILTSQREGLPLVVLESLAAGRPVVATGVGGIPTVIQDGVNGFLIAQHQTDTFCDTLCTLFDDFDRYLKMAQLARSGVQERYNWSAIAQQTERHYAAIKSKSS